MALYHNESAIALHRGNCARIEAISHPVVTEPSNVEVNGECIEVVVSPGDESGVAVVSKPHPVGVRQRDISVGLHLACESPVRPFDGDPPAGERRTSRSTARSDVGVGLSAAVPSN